MPVGELEHVAEVRAAPRVDALRIVADRHDVVVPPAEQVDQLALHLVRVLVFIHKDELKPRLERLAHLAVFAQQPQPLGEQVVEVHHTIGPLAPGVGGVRLGDLVGEALEIMVAFLHHLAKRQAGVERHRQDVTHQVRLGESHRLGVNAGVGDCCAHQGLRVIAVHDGERLRVADRLRVPSQHPVADRVERSSPEPRRVAADQLLHAVHHLAGGLVRERQQQDAVHRDALLEQVGHAVGQRARLARASPGQHQRRPRRCGNSRHLLGVELRLVVDVQLDGRAERVKRVLPWHVPIQTAKCLAKRDYFGELLAKRRFMRPGW